MPVASSKSFGSSNTVNEDSNPSENWGPVTANLVIAEIEALDHQGPAKEVIKAIQAQIKYDGTGIPQEAVDCAYVA